MSNTPLADDIAALQTLVPHLASEVGSEPSEEWISCADLVRPGRALESFLAGLDAEIPDRIVAASVLVQGYALRILGSSLALWLVTGRMPSADAANIRLMTMGGLPARIAWVDPTVAGVAPQDARVDIELRDESELFDWYRADAFDRHLDPFIEAVRGEVRVGRDLLWGNVGAAIGSAFQSLDAARPQRERKAFRAIATRALARLPHDIHRRGSFFELDGDRGGWFWERRSCCLVYQCDPDRQKCDACSLLRPGERRARFANAASAP